MVNFKEHLDFGYLLQEINPLAPDEWIHVFRQEKKRNAALVSLLLKSDETLHAFLSEIPETMWQELQNTELVYFQLELKKRGLDSLLKNHILVRKNQSWEEIAPYVTEKMSKTAFVRLLHNNPDIITTVPGTVWARFPEVVEKYYKRLSLETLNSLFQEHHDFNQLQIITDLHHNPYFLQTDPQPISDGDLEDYWPLYPASWLAPYRSEFHRMVKVSYFPCYWSMDHLWDKKALFPDIFGKEKIWETLTTMDYCTTFSDFSPILTHKMDTILLMLSAYLTTQYDRHVFEMLYPDFNQDVQKLCQQNSAGVFHFLEKYQTLAINTNSSPKEEISLTF